MALPDYARIQTATEKVVRSTGGDAVITMTSVANVAARQSDKIDFGASRPGLYQVFTEAEIAATPTAGSGVSLFLAPSSGSSATTDNLANCIGSDAAYAGYSSNLAASLPQLMYIGDLVTTAQATPTIQKGYVGSIQPPQRYGQLIVQNNSGAAWHSSATGTAFRFVPVVDIAEDT